MEVHVARRFGRHGVSVWERAGEYIRLHKPQCIIAAAVLTVVIVCAAVVPQVSARQKYEESFIATQDTIRIGVRTGVSGFGEIDENGTVAGFDRAVVEELLRRLVDEAKIYEYVPLTSQNAGAALKYGRADIAVGQLTEGTTQTSGFELTQPYYTDRVVALVPDTSRIGSITDLETGIGYLATALSGTEVRDELDALGVDVPLTVYSDYESALTDLSHSRINAVLMPYTTARRLQAMGYRVLAEPLYDIGYRIMLPTSAGAVAQRMNSILSDMLEDGTISALRAHWDV